MVEVNFLDNYKLNDLESIKINFLDKENFKNEVQISKKNKTYLVYGSSFNINSIVDKFLDSSIKKKTVFSDKKFKLEFNVKEIYFDKDSRMNNLQGFLILEKNEITKLNLLSNFSDQNNIRFTIKTKDGEKITTLFS